jgi:glycosyltransferase involved in cell wall biosynthesis/FMN phosphatase YigB (HAD superfamily)
MKGNPEASVAVITRTKDRPYFLERAMQSVLGQTFDDWIHVVVNDGGDPELVEVLARAYSERYRGRLLVVSNPGSLGMQEASNAGIRATDSEYLAIHDDDDSWASNFLSECVHFLSKAGRASLVQGVVTQTVRILEEVSHTGQIVEIKRHPYFPFSLVTLEEMRKRNIFSPICFLFRREAQQRIGYFNQAYDVLGDYDFNLRFLRHFEIGVIDSFHAYYHWRSGSMGNTVTRQVNLHRKMLSLLKNHYYRQWLDDPVNSVGPLDEVQAPATRYLFDCPFNKRDNEPLPADGFPEFDLEGIDLLSLDIFDTVLRRKCAAPKDVFDLLEANSGPFYNGEPVKNLAVARAQAERVARSRKEGAEVTIDEIYDALSELMGFDKEVAAGLMQLEWDLEQAILYPDPRWKAFIEQVSSKGLRTVFLSDMYYSKDQLTLLLERLGFATPEVYVSCDFGCSKHQGTIQPKIAELTGVPPEKIFHVGDNFYSDYIQCVNAGWKAFHWAGFFNYKPWVDQISPFYYSREDYISKRIIGLVRASQYNQSLGFSLSERLGYEVVGPLYFTYLSWVCRTAQNDGIRKLILLGRDGYYWKKALDEMNASEAFGLEYVFMHSSRKVLNFGTFCGLDENAMSFLLTPNPSLRVKDFINRTGLNAEDYQELIQFVGFDDPEEVLTNELGGEYLKPGSESKLRSMFLGIRNELEAIFHSQKEALKLLLKEAQFNPRDTAVVDIGWNASSVRCLSRLFDDDSETVRGFFFGTWETALVDKFEKCNFKSYFVHLEQPTDHALLIRESVNWIESLNSAPFPTLLSLEIREDKVWPVFAEAEHTGFSAAEQEKIWDSAKLFIHDAMKEVREEEWNDASGTTYLFLVLNRLLREPSPSEVEAWGRLRHSEGFGLGVHKQLVEQVPPDAQPIELMSSFDSSNWKRGFLSTLKDHQVKYIEERCWNPPEISLDELRAQLAWKTRQADQYWSEREQHKAEADARTQELERLREDLLALHKKALSQETEAARAHQVIRS